MNFSLASKEKKALYGNIVKFCQPTTGSSNGTKRETFIQNKTIFVFEFDINLG